MDNFDVIVSLTTYKPRIISNSFIITLKSLVAQNFDKKIHIVVTITNDDFKYLTKEQLNFIINNKIEILKCNTNLRPHLKYFYTMMKYKDIPIITVDDDNDYKPNLVKVLYDDYILNGNKFVYACRTHKIQYDKYGNALQYNKWIHNYHQTEPSYDLLATGVGGVLYPPNILKITPSDIKMIYETLTTDDLFLKYRENQLNIKVKNVFINIPYKVLNGEYNARHALCCSDNISNNDINIKKLGLHKINDNNEFYDLEIFLRICDSIEVVHGKREFCDKKHCIDKCFDSLIKSINHSVFIDKKNINLTIITDGISNDTQEMIINKCQNIPHYNIIQSQGNGNINSFKTCYNKALTLSNNQPILFIEDDYICDINGITEILNFYNMFDKNHNDIFINPTTDVGDDGIISYTDNLKKYDTTVVIPSSKNGIGIWWKQTFHSTSTFFTNVSTLKRYDYVFQHIFKQSKLNQYTRNKIFKYCPCFTPLYPLFIHYQKSKTMYWFSKENTEKEIIYNSSNFIGYDNSKLIDLSYRC